MKVLIFPEKGNTKLIAQQLLLFATHPTEVEYVLWPQEGFRVPEELAMKFEAEFNMFDAPLVPASDPIVEVAAPAAEEVEEPVRRKPGRPKKEAV